MGCSNKSADETSTSRGSCASDAVTVAVRFAKAVKAHDIPVYSACESVTAPPDPQLVDQLADFDTLVFEDAFVTGNSVHIPLPPMPNGSLPPHQCGVIIVGSNEPGGWYVSDLSFYCSA